jgi:hypothetical protein
MSTENPLHYTLGPSEEKVVALLVAMVFEYSEIPNKRADQNKRVWRKKLPPCLLIY